MAARAGRPSLHTERLDIIPFTLPLIEVALRSRAALQQALGAQVPAEWLMEEGDEILLLLAEGLRADPAEQHWGWWLIVQRAEPMLVGEVSFRAPPDHSGTVEIGYGVNPPYQGRGYATEAAGAVLAWALGQPGVRRVVASCLQDNAASQRVLEKLGLQRVGMEGALLVWERGCTEDGPASSPPVPGVCDPPAPS